MRPNHAPAALALLVACVALPVWAAPAPGDPKGQMGEIFFLSGLEEQLQILGESLGQTLAPQLQRLPAGQSQALERAILDEFGGDALQRAVESRLEGAYEPAHAAAVLSWLRSPLGRRIAKLDLAASRPEGTQAMQRYAESMATSAPDEGRMTLVRALDTATGMTDFTLEAALASGLATALGANAAMPAARRADEVEIRAAVEAQRGALRGEIERLTLVSMLYSYQSLSEAELGRYIEFSNSEAGRWYHGAVKRALLETLVEASTRVGRTLAVEFGGAADQVPASPAP